MRGWRASATAIEATTTREQRPSSRDTKLITNALAMAKRKGPSTSRPRARSKATKEGSEARTSEGGCVEDECGQLRCEVRALGGERAKVSEKQRELEDKLKEQERKVEEERRKVEDLGEQLRPLRLKEEQLQQNLLPKRQRLEDLCSAREVENAKRLYKLLPEV